MTAVQRLTDEEASLVAILTDPSGCELAEFLFQDASSPTGRYRLWDFQWVLWRHDDKYQIDQLGRGLGKSESSQVRACAFPFNFPGQELLLTAPELSHLALVTDKVESAVLKYRLLREMLPGGGRNERQNGIRKSPHFQVAFANGAKIISRLPHRDGTGVKGCCGAGTRVLTARGHVPIEDVRVGDRVLTHMGRWRPVTHTHTFPVDRAFVVKGGGHRGIVVSDIHRFYARYNAADSKHPRDLQEPDWVTVTDGDIGRYYWALPTQVPALPVVWPEDWDVSNESVSRMEETLRFAGHYVADGILGKDPKARGYVYPGHSGPITRVSITDSTDMGTTIVAVGRLAGYSGAVRPHGEHPATTVNVEVCNRALGRWLFEQFGELSDGKRLPAWLLGAPESLRRAFWEGYAAGDGHYDADRDRTTVTTASRTLAADLRMLVASLGMGAAFSWIDPKVTHIDGAKLKSRPKRSYRVDACGRSKAVRESGFDWTKIKSVTEIPCDFVYDITVDEDHSYTAEGIVHHNTHPLQIELDECQDYPRKGFVELTETIKISEPGASWRVHGVSNGIGDIHYELTHGENPDLPFYVHKYIAAHRPTWNDDERKAKIAMYGGSEDHPDYVRNIFGEPGSIHNPVFVLSRLMSCVLMDQTAWATTYNQDVYTHVSLDDVHVQEAAALGQSVTDLVQIPMGHLDEEYVSYWAGMDVGFTSDPSEILVFGVVRRKGKTDLHRLLTRVSMQRIDATNQVEVIEHLFEHYGVRLKRFGMDKTGVGLPIYQVLMRKRAIASRVAGYGFSEKKAVELDDRPLEKGETQEDLVIKRNVVDHATDVLRKWVDTASMELPYDPDLLGQWRGQGIKNIRGSGEKAVRQYVGGADHTLDAARMFAAAKDLQQIESILETPKTQAPVFDYFL